MSLLERLSKVGSIKHAAVLTDSFMFNSKDVIPSEIPIINVAFSGEVDGGFTTGLTIFSGESKTFKTLLSLYCLKAYFDKYPDAIALFYDCEYGTTPSYFKSYGIDTDRILHIPIEHVEQLKFDIVKRLDEIKRGDHVFILVDSLGALASKKEVEDALNENTAADMSRAKAIRSLLRIITPHLTFKDLPCIMVNHVYKEIGLFPKDVIPGGCIDENVEVLMADGTYKVIKTIVEGDSVQTLNGAKLVEGSWNNEELYPEDNAECVEVTFDDGTSVICTENHKFLIDNNWVCAEDLMLGDEVKCI